MAEERTITQEHFSVLLNWLDPDKDSAAKRYEVIRSRLIRVFAGRGCTEAEVLADLTIDRVTFKAHELNGNYVGDPTLYFYGVANNIYHEWHRRQKKERIAMLPDNTVGEKGEREAEYRCLEKCMAALGDNVRTMMVDYYRDDKRARIERRREMAARMGITLGALQIKTCRVRARLADCVRDCLARV